MIFYFFRCIRMCILSTVFYISIFYFLFLLVLLCYVEHLDLSWCKRNYQTDEYKKQNTGSTKVLVKSVWISILWYYFNHVKRLAITLHPVIFLAIDRYETLHSDYYHQYHPHASTLRHKKVYTGRRTFFHPNIVEMSRKMFLW